MIKTSSLASDTKTSGSARLHARTSGRLPGFQPGPPVGYTPGPPVGPPTYFQAYPVGYPTSFQAYFQLLQILCTLANIHTRLKNQTTNPIMEELFTGVRRKGAYLNGSPIKVSSQNDLITSLLAAEDVPNHDKSALDAATNRINSLLFKVRSLRMVGSCALDLCNVACGRIDLFYLVGFGGPWDVADGAVIVTEAGGLVFDPSGKDFDITAQRVAASNHQLKDKFVEALELPV